MQLQWSYVDSNQPRPIRATLAGFLDGDLASRFKPTLEGPLALVRGSSGQEAFDTDVFVITAEPEALRLLTRLRLRPMKPASSPNHRSSSPRRKPGSSVGGYRLDSGSRFTCPE